MCNHYLNFDTIAREFEITRQQLKEVIEYNPRNLDEFAADDLLEYDDRELNVTSRGFFLIRNIAMAFDPLMKSTQQNRYSKTI